MNASRRDSYTPTLDLAQKMGATEETHTRTFLSSMSKRKDPNELRGALNQIMHRLGNNPQLLDEVQALHFVAWKSQLNDMAQYLLRLGCNPFTADYNGDTVFHYAVRGGNLTFLRYLYERVGDSMFTVLVRANYQLSKTLRIFINVMCYW